MDNLGEAAREERLFDDKSAPLMRHERQSSTISWLPLQPPPAPLPLTNKGQSKRLEELDLTLSRQAAPPGLRASRSQFCLSLSRLVWSFERLN